MDESILQRQLGLAIRTRRTALGISQEAFADAIKMHRAYYSKVERGEKNLTLHTLLRVTRGLGVVPSELFISAGI